MSQVGTETVVEGSAAEVDSTAETGDGPTEPVGIEKDDLFHVLQSQRRRRVLNYLRTVEGSVDMRDVAEQIAAWENGKETAAITSEERQRVYIALYQSHLPKLDGMGIVEYDQDRGTIERTDLADEFDPYLDVDERSDVDASADESTTDDATVYYAATLVGLALAAAMWAGVAPASISGSLAPALTVLFGVVTLGLVIRDRR